MLLQRWSFALLVLRSALILQHVWAFECWTTTEIIITMSAEREYLCMKDQKIRCFSSFFSFFFDRRFIEFTTNTKNRNSSLKKTCFECEVARRGGFTFDLCQAHFHIHNIIIFYKEVPKYTLNFHHNSSPIDSDFHCLWVIGSHSKHESSGQNYKTEKRSWAIICAIADISRRDRCCVRSTEREREIFLCTFFLSYLSSL